VALLAAAPVLLLGRRRVDRFLAGWFLVMLVVLALQGALSVEALGTDANLYRFAASSYMAGADPWNRAGGDWAVFQFAGLPPTILAFVPFAFLPEPVVMALWVALSLAAAILIVRALRLPLYWLLFPPLVGGVWSGNPHIVVVALLLGRAASLAPILKIYGAVPLIGERRWSALLLSGALVALTVVAAPGLWRDYLTQAADVSARLVAQAGPMSAYGFPILMALVAFVLALLFSRRELGWLAVPALWPGTEFIYSSMALPVITPVLATALAVPFRGSPVIAIVIAGFVRLIEPRYAGLYRALRDRDVGIWSRWFRAK
jgi:hypothetical protein